MATLNNELKNKASILKIDVFCYSHSSRAVFRTLLGIYGGNLFAKMVRNFNTA